MRVSILLLAFLVIAAPAYGQEFERPDVNRDVRRFARFDLAAAKAGLAEKYPPSLAVSVITPREPGAVFSGATFVAGPSLRLGVQWPF